MAPRLKARKDYKELMSIADKAVEIKGKGRKKTTGKIVKDAAEDLFEQIEKDGTYSDAEKLAAKEIREEYQFTDAGRELFAELLRDWALERGRATQAAEAAAREAEETAAEAKKAAAKKKEKAKTEVKEAKKDAAKVRTTKIGGEELDYNLIKYALSCVESNITEARAELKEEDYEKGDVGGNHSIGVDDVKGLVELVFEDGEYSELERATMAWIRSNIGMTPKAREAWEKQYNAAKKAAKAK